MTKTLYFSGTHGTGKTTTIAKLLELFDTELFSSGDGDHGNPYQSPYPRQVWRLNKYYLDALAISEREKQLAPGRLQLVDRCVFDHEAYTRTFLELGWLTQAQFDKIESLRCLYFDDSSVMPQNVVLFMPQEGWTVARIKERWNDEKKKWNEGDFDYLKVLREKFEEIYEREKQLRRVLVVSETDLNSRVKIIGDYISRLRAF